MDWIQSPLAISHYSSRTSSGGEMRTNKTLFALTSMIHYQSGEDIVVILCHHPHGLCLEGGGDRGWERKVWTNGDRGEKMVISSRQGVLESTARWEQTKPHGMAFISKGKTYPDFNEHIDEHAVHFVGKCHRLLRFLRHMCSRRITEQQLYSELFYAFKRFRNGSGHVTLPQQRRAFNQKSSVISVSWPSTPSLPLVSLNLHSKAPLSHGGCASLLIVPSAVEGEKKAKVM